MCHTADRCDAGGFCNFTGFAALLLFASVTIATLLSPPLWSSASVDVDAMLFYPRAVKLVSRPSPMHKPVKPNPISKMYRTENRSSESKIESGLNIEQYRYFGESFQPYYLASQCCTQRQVEQCPGISFLLCSCPSFSPLPR